MSAHLGPRDRFVSPHLAQRTTAAADRAEAALRALLDVEGEEAVTRVHAQVVADARFERFVREASRRAGGPLEHDTRPHSHPGRLGHGGGVCDDECTRSRASRRIGDHEKHWRVGDRFVLVTTDDEVLTWQRLQELVDFCRQRELEAAVSANDCFFHAGRTVQVRVTPPGQSV